MAITSKPKADPTVIPALPTPAKKPSAANKTKLPTIKPVAGKTTLAATVAAKAAPKPVAKSAIKTTAQSSKASQA